MKIRNRLVLASCAIAIGLMLVTNAKADEDIDNPREYGFAIGYMECLSEGRLEIDTEEFELQNLTPADREQFILGRGEGCREIEIEMRAAREQCGRPENQGHPGCR